VMMKNGPGVLNCRMAPARGSASEKISPRNGSRFKSPQIFRVQMRRWPRQD
jgi:hypothetical protein